MFDVKILTSMLNFDPEQHKKSSKPEQVLSVLAAPLASGT